MQQSYLFYFSETQQQILLLILEADRSFQGQPAWKIYMRRIMAGQETVVMRDLQK